MRFVLDPQVEPTENDIVVRRSWLDSIKLCPARIAYREQWSEPYSEPIHFGLMDHNAIEHIINTGTSIVDVLADIKLLNKWSNDICSEQGWSLTVPNYDEIRLSLSLWDRQVRPLLTPPIAVEQELFLKIGEDDERSYFIKGSPDYVEPTRCVDWKTAGRGWHESKAHTEIQPGIYLALIKHKLGVELEDFDYYVYNRQKEVWELHKTQRKNLDAELENAWEYIKAIASNSLPATPYVSEYGKTKRGWYCSDRYCPAWNVCTKKGIGNAD